MSKCNDNNHRKHCSSGNAGIHSDSCNRGDGTYHNHCNEINLFVPKIIKEFTRDFRNNQKRSECERKLQGRNRGREGEGSGAVTPSDRVQEAVKCIF